MRIRSRSTIFLFGSSNSTTYEDKIVVRCYWSGSQLLPIILRPLVDAPLDGEHLIFQDQSHLVVHVDSNSQQQAVQVDSDSRQANADIAHIMRQLIACLKELKSCNRKLNDMLSNYVEEYMTEVKEKDHISVDNNLVIDALRPEIINNLHEVVKLMVAAGFEKECCDMYSSCRRECLEEYLPLLRVLRLNIEDLVQSGQCHLNMRFRFGSKLPM